MDDHAVIAVAVAVIAIIVPLSAWLAFSIVTRQRRRSDQPSWRDMEGLLVVPVRRLRRSSGFFGRSENSISPHLAVAPDGVHFKVFKQDRWSFSEIAEVDAPRAPFATPLAIRNHAGARLYIDLSDTSKGRQFLQAFPPTVRFTGRASELRDGVG